MTKKDLEWLTKLAAVNFESDYLTDDMKMDRMKEIWKFLETARDLFLIDETQRSAWCKEITAAAMAAHDKRTKQKTA